MWDDQCTSGHGPATLLEASEVPLSLISTTSTPDATNGTLRTLVDIENTETSPDREMWQDEVDNLLRALKGGSEQEGTVRDQPTEDAIQVSLSDTVGTGVCHSVLQG